MNRLLDAYLDRELDQGEATAAGDHLAACAGCRRLLADREALGQLVRQAPYYTASPRLRARVLAQSRTSPARQRRPWTWAAAALIAASVVGAVLTARWSVGPLRPVDSVAEAIVDSHVRALMGDHLFDVRSTDQHTVKPWFLGKLDFAPPVDDLAGLGFPLTGGRLDYVAGRVAAALVYTRGQHTINVFVWPEAAAAARLPAARSIRGFHVRSWSRAGMSFWAVSDLNDAELDQFVRELQP